MTLRSDFPLRQPAILCTLLLSLSLFVNCSSPDLSYELGMVEVDKQEYESAIEYFKAGLKNNPDDAYRFHYALGRCYFELSDYAMAKKELNKTIALNKYFPGSYFLMAKIFSRNGDFEKAIDYYSQAIAIEPDPRLFTSRGFIYIRMNKFEAALNDLDEALELNPEDAYALSNRGLVKTKLNRLSEARLDLEKSKRADASNPYMYKHLALLNLAEKDTPRACINLQEAKDKGYSTFGNEIDKHEVDDLLRLHCQ
ncbi:MAG: tetratricopeptide repeat protein [Roseivirga sp.]|nr:tetratricopeptide repeat protein [Roseivirga sp.]